MSETLSFEPQTETTSVENLSEEEQDSLKVGQELREQQDQLLAGKYENAQELEKAYVELEKKLGSSEQKTDETPTPEVPEAKEEPKKEVDEKPAQTNLLDDLWEQAQTETFKDETLAELKNMKPEDLANMHLQYRNANSQRDLSEADVQELKGIVGGEENYSNMMDWAGKSLNKQEIDMFDSVMERGDPLAAFFAVRSLAYRYNDAVGFDGKMVTGTAPKESNDQFRSQAEVVQAMSDPRYELDPAYRQDIMNKLSRSKVSFRK